MPDKPPSAPLYELGLEVQAEFGFRALEVLEAIYPPPTASGLTDLENGQWRVWGQFQAPLDVARMTEAMRAAGIDIAAETVVMERLPDDDWVARAQSGLAPVLAGRFIVHGRHDRTRVGRRAYAIEIEAGQAFGTAHHGSTLGCLLALDALFKRVRFARMLDLGTGSGLLAIAAARAQRLPVLASDIDPIAIRIASDNARLNRVAPLVHTVCAQGLTHPSIRGGVPFDLVTANILARPLIDMAPGLARRVMQGGHAVLAGILHSQANAVAAAYRTAGFTSTRRIAVGGWTTLLMQRRRSRLRG